ncbi:hypothetical protein [Planobispora rosea]|uniref:hypothetical protein n=1 Tax=Planobispora rosea TaxID=35762 RepID=UPI00114CFB15|nr:hypothetical protein [Planobispora rosea]
MTTILIVIAPASLAITPASAAADACRFVPDSLTAVDLQEDAEEQDEVFLKVGGDWWPSYLTSATFALGQTRGIGTVSEEFTDRIRLELWEDDTWPNGNDLIDVRYVSEGGAVSCRNQPFSVSVGFTDGDAHYLLRAVVGPA